ncbi:MAG: HEAT repeat domain-containing protein [Merismopedia sp. SIO2A8]|nr:HEAT repeat domain-containing protein [Merismopedia sp. SIO2A8]
MTNRFDHIFNLTEEQAIALLQTPREKLEDGTDRYIAASQLAKFPSERTITVLIDAVNNADDDHLDNRIVRRKAIESLGRLNAIEALPAIQSCLEDGDCYIVENAIWAIGEMGSINQQVVNDIVLEKIANVLERPKQNYRVAIHTLAKFGYIPAIDRIRPFTESGDHTIKSAAIATLCRLTNDYSQMSIVVELLQHTDLNARRGCIQDLVDTQYYDAIPNIACAPVSVAFRLRGIRLLVDAGLATGKVAFEAIAPYLDQVIRDHPQDIEMVHEYDQKPSLKFLINELYETDLGRCYLATQTILEEYPDQAATEIMATFQEKAHHDYGGHYHVMKLLGWLQHEPGYGIVLNHGLNNIEPQFQKSRMATSNRPKRPLVSHRHNP